MTKAKEEDGIPESNFPEEKFEANIHKTEEEENDSPIEEVRLTVPPTDDPSEPALTFRTWVLGLASCCLLAFVNHPSEPALTFRTWVQGLAFCYLLAFVNHFFGYRQNQLYVSPISVQILVLPLGKLMAATLLTTVVQISGPFTLKEHVLIVAT